MTSSLLSLASDFVIAAAPLILVAVQGYDSPQCTFAITIYTFQTRNEKRNKSEENLTLAIAVPSFISTNTT